MIPDVELQSVAEKLLLFVPQIVSGIVLLLISWLLAIISKRIVRRLGNVRQLDPQLVVFLARAAHLGVLSFGVVTALGTMGIQVTALVAGLGLTGFALGLALKDIISNAISGILLLLYRPVKTGDTVNVAAFEGRVIEINLRYTVLAGEDATIFVPNSTLFSNGIQVRRVTEPAG